MATNPIKSKVKPDGTKIYYWRIETGRDPVTGKRTQLYRQYTTLKEAKKEYAKATNSIHEKTYVAPAKLTLNTYLDEWVPGHCRDLEESTKRNVVDALKPARERLGERELQRIEKKDIEALTDWMMTAGRKRGGKPGTGLKPRSVQLALNTLSQALDMAVQERKLSYNPVRLVKRPKAVKPKHELWSDEEETQFFDAIAGNRLSTVVDLFALGLRPEELCGIRWPDIDTEGLTVAAGTHVRTWVVKTGAVEKEAKTEAGIRTLPIAPDLGAGLKAWRAVQRAEKAAAGTAYEDGGYVLCDELGKPYDPPRLRRKMYVLMKAAGVKQVTPYEAMRHAAASRLARANVPGHQIAAWLGHANASFTYDTYVHARPEDLAAARDGVVRIGKVGEASEAASTPTEADAVDVADDAAPEMPEAA